MYFGIESVRKKMKPSKNSLFNAYGIEAEYMIVDKDNLNISPSAHILLTDTEGAIHNEITKTKTAWSNELASHLIEIKTNGPVQELDSVSQIFHEDIIEINNLLSKDNLMLMPTAMHPWMSPDKEFVIWSHENQEIYNAYNLIFNCKGHGWSNLQSVHINLGFQGEEEFIKLHSAIRILLPLIPCLSASSPIYERKLSHYLDTRLHFYFSNQQKIPEIAGQIIPEVVLSKKDYFKIILNPMYKAISRFDSDQLLQDEWLNSRGAIARFDRSAIEIRLMDTQECPLADLSLVKIFDKLLKYLVENRSIEEMNRLTEKELLSILEVTIINGTKTFIDNSKFLKLFGISSNGTSVLNIFIDNPIFNSFDNNMISILRNYGNLSERILTTNPLSNSTNLKNTYKNLCGSLHKNEFFIPV